MMGRGPTVTYSAKREDHDSAISYGHQRRKIRPWFFQWNPPGWTGQMKEEDQGGLRTNRYGKLDAKGCKGRLVKCKQVAVDWFDWVLCLITPLTPIFSWNPISILFRCVGVLSILSVCLRIYYINGLWFLSAGVEEQLRPPMLTCRCSLFELFMWILGKVLFSVCVGLCGRLC